jgi:hypothetical protein
MKNGLPSVRSITSRLSGARELRELVRLRTRYVDELSDRMRQLHRAVDLGFPEFTRWS